MMKNKKQMQAVVALAVVVAAAALVASASAAITCGQVGSALAPCIPYATGKASALPSSCCGGVRSLRNEARCSRASPAILRR